MGGAVLASIDGFKDNVDDDDVDEDNGGDGESFPILEHV